MDSTFPPQRFYSIQEAARLLDLEPGRLRAWERRFGVPRPRRAANGYRLYSPADLEVLRRLKAQTDGGVRISLAVEAIEPANGRISADALRSRLQLAILNLDERQASSTLREALGLHPAELVLSSIVEPLMRWIGDEWQAGRLSVGVEHFASATFVRQLLALLMAAPEPWQAGRVLAAGVPGDQHEIGLLMLSVGLRRRGWDVRYLGANLPLDDLAQAAAALKPEVILLSATRQLTDTLLAEIVDLPRRLPSPSPDLVVGGQGLRSTDGVSGRATLLDAHLNDALAALETLLLRRTHAR